MALFDQLFTATLNGVPFLVDSSEMTQGRKTKTFEYPNKKYRYVEDLGENLRTFTINAVINGSNDYLIRREAFTLALQKKGISVLTHPFYGLVFVTVINYSITENLNSLGECIFNITFLESQPSIFPVVGNESIASLTGIIEETAPYLSAYFITKFSVSFQKNTIDAANKCTKLNDNLQPNKPVSTENNALNEFKTQSLDFENNKYSLVQDASLLVATLYNLLNAYNNLGQTATDSYALNSSVYYVGDTDVTIESNTAERQQRILNRKVFNSYANATLLMNLYANALQITYYDDQQVLQYETDLEEKYQYLMNNNAFDVNTSMQLAKLRNSATRFFNQLKVNISKVINVTVPRTNLTVLLYRYYANFNNENEIISLNNLNNVTKIEGNVRMLTES